MRTIATDDRTTFAALSVGECVELLRWERIGRLAVGVRGEAPIVVPVNFAFHDDCIVFRSDDGPNLDRIREQPVSLQVDRLDWFRRTGWSVLVRGVAHEVDHTELESLDVEPWAPGRKAHWVRIVPTAISGRRLELDQSPLDPRGYL